MIVEPRDRISLQRAMGFGAGMAPSRRSLVLGVIAGLIGAPMVLAQVQRKPARLGLLSYIARSEADSMQGMQPFLAAMRERGYVLGEHFILDIRVSGGDARRLPALADELIALKPDVLLAIETPALAMAARTSTIPIVLVGSVDPVAAGLVKSLARPGTNVTGMAGQTYELIAKHIELLSELVPKGARIAAICDPFWSAREDFERAALRAAAIKGLHLTFVYVKDAGEVRQAFAEFEKRRPDGLIFGLSGFIRVLRETIREEVLRLRLPAIGAEFGGSVSYREPPGAGFHEAADFVDRILKGARPADLPLRQATRIHLVVNMKTARDTGLKIPQSILLRADEVIE